LDVILFCNSIQISSPFYSIAAMRCSNNAIFKKKLGGSLKRRRDTMTKDQRQDSP